MTSIFRKHLFLEKGVNTKIIQLKILGTNLGKKMDVKLNMDIILGFNGSNNN